MIKTVWLSFDLSLNGDYDGLFKWLDERSAKECGDGLAFFEFEFHTTNEQEELIRSIAETVSINNKRDRIYAIWMRQDDKVQGSFLFGSRKRAPWDGASGGHSNDIDG